MGFGEWVGHSTVGPRPAAARLGQEPVAISLSGRVPATARTASAGVAAGVCRDGLTRTILKAKVESLSLPRTLTVIVTTAQNELKDGDPTSRMLFAGGKLRQLSFPISAVSC